MKKPKFSIVTVNLNNAEVLANTIQSVSDQDYPNKEYIVVDGASTDHSLELIASNTIIDRYISEKDQGIYDAMNKGLSMCSEDSDLVIFMNAGDRFASKDVLSRVASHWTTNTQHLFGDINKGGRFWPSPAKLNNNTLSTDMVCHQAIFFNTKLHQQMPYDTSYRLCSDYKALLSMLDKGQSFKKVPVIVSDFDDTGISSQQRNRLKEEKQAIRKEFRKVQVLFRIKKAIRKFR